MNPELIQVRAYRRLVGRFLSENQWVMAQQVALKAVRQHPQNALAWLLLADTARRPHDQVLALRMALSLNPELLEARRTLDRLEAEGARPGTGLLPQLSD